MTTPARRIRRTDRRRPFDLRATTLFFTLAALVLAVLGLTVRAAAAAAERRPVWATVLGLIAAAAVVLAVRRRRRGPRARSAARRAAAALQEGTRTALDALEAPPARPAAPADPGPPAAAVDAVDYGALAPDEFEQAVAALCERDGCARVEVVGGAGDLGADVLAVAPDGRRVVIQCKRYGDTHRVGSEELQRFGGTCYTVHEADVAVVVTTSDFTAPAVEYAERCGIVCLDRQALRAWSEGTGAEPWRQTGPS
ncbi:restriction endonuclease [Streptomyces sp. NTH33]|uniref:restriction endonuclease n=1 Tax=Streptomyces sp. NTH33 TaxID=1735453 RepID=UPI000DA7398C|nr:restriction endonuclease [Streptomyces sp. NTH33]PZH08780.1 restriction endonuclease [Streptomyces sp. NTH33]